MKPEDFQKISEQYKQPPVTPFNTMDQMIIDAEKYRDKGETYVSDCILHTLVNYIHDFLKKDLP